MNDIDSTDQGIPGLTYDVVLATIVSEAEQICRTNALDLLLCDLKAPDKDGWMLAKLAEDRSIPAIAVSALTCPADLQRSRDSGFKARIRRPADFQHLLRVIEEVRKSQGSGDEFGFWEFASS